jgi:phosphohistidine phosphatase
VTQPGRTLWLLRHAKAVADPPDGGDDFDRVLAPRGRRDAEALGRLVARRGSAWRSGAEPLPQIAFVSPAARTMATADLVLAGVTLQPRRSSPADLYGAEPEDVLRRLRRRVVPDDHDRGHAVVDLAQALALGLLDLEDKGRDDVIRRGFPTCALGIYRLDIAQWADVGGQCASLVDLLTPPFEED